MEDIQEVTYREARLAEIIGLRDAVLIAGTDRDSPEFPGDHDPSTHHFGAFHEGICIGCATFMQSKWEGAPTWQLRGMATLPECRGRGVGGVLLDCAVRNLSEASDIRRFWCNARVTAETFYTDRGWTKASEEFNIEGVGSHVRLVLTA
jgi:predicted GNAT family N-acyltransferase